MKTQLMKMCALIFVMAAFSCSDDAKEPTANCGSGEFVEASGVGACVYRQSVVVENGFKCPAAFPNLIQSGGIAVCSPDAELGDGLLDEFEEVYRDRRPDDFACMIDQNCLASEKCVANRCEPDTGGNVDAGMGDAGTDAGTEPDAGADAGVECSSDAECAELEVCLDGRCIVLEMAPCSDDTDCAPTEVCFDSQCMAADECGGLLGQACSAGYYCEYTDSEPNGCGIADGSGFCRTVPEACSTDVAEVCGCDGVTYTNECEANRAGTDILATGPCS